MHVHDFKVIGITWIRGPLRHGHMRKTTIIQSIETLLEMLKKYNYKDVCIFDFQ